MHFSTLFTASLAAAPFVAAHGGIPGAPKIWGLRPNDAAKLKRRAIVERHAQDHSHARRHSELNKRQGGLNGMCGPTASGASCDEGYCCSAAGYCGQGSDFCIAPDGLFQYGPANDANVLPAGGSTRSIARPQLGSIAYGGAGVYHCTVPGTVAITYDDGPYLYTQGVVDMFNSYGFKATFFITGNNNGKGPIDSTSSWSTVIQNMIAGGHQVASHTWSHQDLSTLTQAQRYEQMIKNEMAFANILGKFPTYMRPPYSSCTAPSGCQQDLTDLGYVVSYFDLDTDDYNNLAPEKIQNAKNNFNGNVTSTPATTGDWLSIAHDIHEISATNLTKFMLDDLKSLGYKGVTMGECLGDPVANWYRAAAAGARTATTSSFSRLSAATATAASPVASTAVSAAATPTGLKVSQDGTCGNGYTCIGYDASVGSCCSQYGWCGNDTDHCGTGCQSAFGTCGGVSSVSVVNAVVSTAASSKASSATASVSAAAVSSAASSSVRVSSASASAASSSSRVSSAGASSASSSSARVSSTGASSAAASSSVRASSAAASSVASLSASSSPALSAAAGRSTTLSTTKASSSVPISFPAVSMSTKTSALPSSTPAASSSVKPTSSSTKVVVASVQASSSSAKTSATPSPSSLTLSTNGQCGGTTKQTCNKGSSGIFGIVTGILGGGSAFGSCCSQFGICGSTLSYCAAGCQAAYGLCM